MGDLMHPFVDSCMLDEPCNETRSLRRVKTFVQLARGESFRSVIAVKFHVTVLVDKSVCCKGKLYVNR
jgi:hypothetical protein